RRELVEPDIHNFLGARAGQRLRDPSAAEPAVDVRDATKRLLNDDRLLLRRLTDGSAGVGEAVVADGATFARRGIAEVIENEMMPAASVIGVFDDAVELAKIALAFLVEPLEIDFQFVERL